jgi:hypothetical protein
MCLETAFHYVLVLLRKGLKDLSKSNLLTGNTFSAIVEIKIVCTKLQAGRSRLNVPVISPKGCHRIWGPPSLQFNGYHGVGIRLD